MSIFIKFSIYHSIWQLYSLSFHNRLFFWDQCYVVTCHKALIFVDLLYVFFFISTCVHDFIIAVMSFFATMINQRDQLFLAFCWCSLALMPQSLWKCGHLLDVNYLVFIKRLFELNCFRSRRAFIIRTICTTGMYSNSYKQFNVLIQFIFLWYILVIAFTFYDK